ncbi:multiple epidermal growth factor-like domains protein 6 [Arapaima gigas]
MWSSILIDVNECEETNGGCEALCCNTIGSFYCKCPSGQELKEDGKTCQAHIDPEGTNHSLHWVRNVVLPKWV